MRRTSSKCVFGLALSVGLTTIGLEAQNDRQYLPLATQTPGKTTKLTKEQLCAADFAPRELSERRKVDAFARYGMANNPGDRVVDQLVPARLGGSDEVDNLWPQPPKGEWSAATKDQLEAKLVEKVCSGQLELKDAQKAIRSNWVKAYREHVAGTVNTK